MAIKCYLSRALGERRINISEFSKTAGVARNTITSLYHEDAKGITWAVLDKLCVALNCQPNDLIEHIPDKPLMESLRESPNFVDDDDKLVDF